MISIFILFKIVIWTLSPSFPFSRSHQPFPFVSFCSLNFPHGRLFRFCHYPREFCPLCGKRWLWEHFFTCCKLDVAPDLASGPLVLATDSSHIAQGQWDVFKHYLRFYLLEWSDLLSQVAFPIDIIDNLC